MAKWLGTISNALFTVACVCGAIGFVLAVGSFDRPGVLSVSQQIIDVGDLAPGQIVPIAFTLHNASRLPIRLVGAGDV